MILSVPAALLLTIVSAPPSAPAVHQLRAAVLHDAVARQRFDQSIPVLRHPARPASARRGASMATKITAGIAGGIAGFYAGAIAGGGITAALDHREESALAGVAVGGCVGAVLGSVFGTWLASR